MTSLVMLLTALAFASEYPFVLAPVNEEKLSIMRAEFFAANPHTCTQINRYGFTSYGKCYGPDILGRGRMKDELKIRKLVRRWLVKNSRFTGIESESDFKEMEVEARICPKDLPPNTKCTANLGVSIEPRYKGLRLVSTPPGPRFIQIGVFADARGISSIFGHGVPSSVRVLVVSKISEKTAKNTALKKHKSADIEKIEKVIFERETKDGLEFRLAWAFHLSFDWNDDVPGMSPPNVRETAVYFLDAITGEEL